MNILDFLAAITRFEAFKPFSDNFNLKFRHYTISPSVESTMS
jgi:hypothetical protein